MVGVVCGLNFVVCPLYHLKSIILGQGFCYLSLSHSFCPPFWCVSLAFEVY
jgi:hypothetical protein